MHEPESRDAETIPCSPYAASKTACTAYARMFHALYGTPVVVARPMMVYGPGQWDVSKLLPYVVTSMLDGTSPAVASGSRLLDWVYVQDVVDGLMTVATAPGLDGQTVDLGTGELVSVKSIVDRVASIIGTKVPVAYGAVPDRRLERPRAAHVERTRRLLGWYASTSLNAGLERTIDWWRQGAPDTGMEDVPSLSGGSFRDTSPRLSEPRA